MAEEILIRINLQSGEAKTKINEVKKATDNLSKSIDKLSKSELATYAEPNKWLKYKEQITKSTSTRTCFSTKINSAKHQIKAEHNQD